MCVPKHVNLVADVGLRDNMLRLLACYNPLWLRLALEAITGEEVPLGSSHADASALRRFLDQRVLRANVSAPKGEEGAHFEETAKRAAAYELAGQHKIILRRVLALIVLLDAAKQCTLLKSDPCLFVPNVAVRSSKEMVQEFCKLAISGGVGDINKHLGTLGIVLHHKQTPLHEYNFAVTNLAADMRDGVRLCKLVDLTVSAPSAGGSLVSQVRVPADTRLLKLRNTKLALERMLAAGALVEGSDGAPAEAFKRTTELLVQGHCETTLEVLWSMISREIMPRLAPPEAVAQQVELARRAAKRSHTSVQISALTLKAGCDADVSVRLLAWVSAVAAVKGVRVHDLGAGLRDGVALCLLVRHYLPDVMPPDAALDDTDDDMLADGRAAAEGGLVPAAPSAASLRAAEARMGSLAAAVVSVGGVPPLVGASSDAHGCGPDAHVAALFLACLFSRLTEVGAQSQAAQLLQIVWVNRKHRTNARANLRVALFAARLQRRWRAKRQLRMLRATKEARTSIRRSVAARVSRTRFSKELARLKTAHEMRHRLAARVLQRAAMLLLLARRCGAAALVVQSIGRGMLARATFQKQRDASVRVQAASRRHAAIRAAHRLREEMRAAAATAMQAAMRRLHAVRVRAAARSAALTLQAGARRFAASRLAATLLAARREFAATALQAANRRLAATHRLRTARTAALTLQASTRRHAAINVAQSLRAEKRRAAATALQAAWRRRAARVLLHKSMSAATSLQSHARRLAAQRVAFRARHVRETARLAAEERARRLVAAVHLESRARTFLARRTLTTAVAAATALAAAERARAAKARLLTAVLQATYLQMMTRRHLAHAKYTRQRAAAITLGAAARRHMAVKTACRVRAARRLQARARAQAARAKYARARAAVTSIAARARTRAASAAYVRALRSAVAIQSAARSMRYRKLYGLAVEASTKLQAMARQRAAIHARCVRAAARSIQSAARRIRQTVAFQSARAAVTRVSAAWRRLMATRRLVLAKRAATSMQTSARRATAQRRLAAQKYAALTLQTSARRHTAINAAQRLRAEKRRASATALQAASRRRAARRQLCIAITAATRLEALGRRSWATKLVARRRAIAELRQKMAETFAQKLAAAGRMQRRARVLLARNALLRAVGAATTLTAGARVWAAKARLAAARASATRLQAAARRAAAVRARHSLHQSYTTIRAALARHALHRRARRTAGATVLQAHWRGESTRVRLAAHAHAASRIAATWRAHVGVRTLRTQRRGVTKVQAAARGLSARFLVATLRRACGRLQSAGRGYAARRLARQLRAVATSRAAAAVAMQCWVRRKVATKHTHALREMAKIASLAMLHRAARLVQDVTRFRQLLQRRVRAARHIASVAKTTAAVRRLGRIKIAVRRLQAMSRARMVRAMEYARRPELAEIAARAARARAAGLADPSLWLCNRTNVALGTLLKSENLGEVLRAVSSLEMFTMIARNVCVRMVDEGAIPVLFGLLASCNSSVPHQKIIGHGLRALTNIAKLANLRAPICEQPGSLSTLIDLAQGYRDKAAHTRLWDVLQLLCELVLRGPAEWKAKVVTSRKGAELLKRLDGLHGLLSRAALKEGGPTANSAAGSRRTSTVPTKPPPAKGGAVAKGGAAAKGGAPVKGKAAPMELAPKCIGALKALLASMAKE